MFALVIVLAWLLALTPLILISGVNRTWGVSDYIFAFGDEVVNDAAAFMIQMPIFVLCAELCPVYVCNDITLLCSALSFSSTLSIFNSRTFITKTMLRYTLLEFIH
jgi:hypothetical protein